MKKFLLKISLFLALSALVFGGAVVFYLLRERSFEYAFPRENHILFIGHSHIEVGVDPARVPESINWAKSADNFHTCAARLQLALRDNPQIDTVFLAVAPHNFKKNVDAGFGSEGDCSYHALDYFPIYGLKKSWEIWGFGFVKEILKNPLKLGREIFKTQEKKKKALGGFLYHKAENLQRDLSGGFEKRSAKKGEERFCGEGIFYGYFRQMADACKARNIRVIALNMPLYEPEKFYDMPYFYATFRRFFPDVEMWDYAHFPLPDEFRADINHINRRGAEVFSKELCARMRREKILRD